MVNNDKILYENYFNGCDRNSHIHVYSVTKSIVSILVGIAIDKGYIKSIEQNISDFYIVNLRNQNITLKNLLTMTTPYCYIIPPYKKYFTSDDWVKFSLDSLSHKKPGKFKYAPLIGPDIISGILVKTTGKSVLDFAKENLFKPLGINIKEDIIFHSKEEQLSFNNSIDMNGWVADPKGINTAGWGLTLSTRDMATIGQLYLNKGKYNDLQIVSKEWIKESTKEQSYWKKEKLSYGYLWWVSDDGFAAMGDGGNIIYVNTQKQMIVAITALFQSHVKDRITFIKKCIEPFIE